MEDDERRVRTAAAARWRRIYEQAVWIGGRYVGEERLGQQHPSTWAVRINEEIPCRCALAPPLHVHYEPRIDCVTESVELLEGGV